MINSVTAGVCVIDEDVLYQLAVMFDLIKNLH